MKTRNTTLESHGLTIQIDAFLAFKLRIESQAFYAAEVRRHQRRGERALAEIAAIVPTGDVLRDARWKTSAEAWLEEIIDDYHLALDRLAYEMEGCDSD